MTDDLKSIHKRNRRVETDKAWETSWTRRFIIAAGTYVIVAAYLTIIGIESAPRHAAVPAGAYLISTLTLPVVKKLWITRFYKSR